MKHTSLSLTLALGIAALSLPIALSAHPNITPIATPQPAPTAASLLKLQEHVSAPISAPASEVTPRALPTANPASRVHSMRLSNGLHVVVVEDHAAAVVQTGMWYRFGALDETPGKTGLAHGLEHMMFRGTPSLSEGGLDDVSARLGAEENANTANDYTHFYLVLPASKLELSLRIEADRMRNLLLSEHDWQLEKGAVLSEYDGDLGAPATHLINDLCLAVTPTPICGLGALGKRSDIVQSHAADLRHYYNQYYYPNNATLVVVGDVHASEVFVAAQRAFGAIATHPIPLRNQSVPTLHHHGDIHEKGDFPYTLSDSVYPFSGDKDPDAGPAAIIDGIINDQRSAMYDALVLSGVTLGYETSANANLHGGLEHVIFILAPNHTPEEARRIFTQSMQTVLAKGIPPDLFAAAKRAAALNAIYARDSISGLGDRVGYAVGVEGRTGPSEDDALIANTTLEQTAAYAKRVFAAPLVIGVLSPEHPKPGSKPPATGAAVADNFSNRAPSGPVYEAPWVKAALAKPVHITSRVAPTRYVLSNGIKLYVQPVHENPTIFVSGSIDGTNRFESPQKTGLRAMVSGLLDYGSDRYDFDAQRRIQDELGASIDLGVNFGAHGLARDLPQILDILADGEEHPAFPKRYVTLVRDQSISQIAAQHHDPDYHASHAFARELFGANDPAVREATDSTIRNISIDDLRSYTQRYLRPDLTSITIVGDITPEAARASVEHAFASWHHSGPRPDVTLPAIHTTRASSTHVLATRRLVTVRLGQAAVTRSSPDFAAFNLLNAILGGGGTFDTRLMHEIRERRGLVYSVSSSLQSSKYRGVLGISLSASPDHVAPAVSLVREQLTLLTKQAPTQDELNRARERLIGGSLVAEESTSSIVDRVATIAEFDLPTDNYQTLAQRYGRVTPAQILAVAKKYLHPNQLAIVYEGP